MPSAVDTNVLIHFIVDDGSGQGAAARQLFSGNQVWISLSVMLETEWVLRSNFGFQRGQICDAFDRILGVDSITFQDVSALRNAVDSGRTGLDFADALHMSTAANCDVFYTFDKKLIRVTEREILTPMARQPVVYSQAKEMP